MKCFTHQPHDPPPLLTLCVLRVPSQAVQRKRPSQLIEHAGDANSGKKKRRGSAASKPVVMPLTKVLELIGRLYMEKARADNWIDGKLNAKEEEENAKDGKEKVRKRSSVAKKSLQKVRFDAFVLKHFKSLHGTKGIARRHLRNFVVSVQHLAKDHPRVDVFRKLCGIPGLVQDDAEPYIPTLVVRYVIPLLMALFGKHEEIGRVMTGGDVLTAPMQQVIAHVEPNLAGVYFGSRMVRSKRACIANVEMRERAGHISLKSETRDRSERCIANVETPILLTRYTSLSPCSSPMNPSAEHRPSPPSPLYTHVCGPRSTLSYSHSRSLRSQVQNFKDGCANKCAVAGDGAKGKSGKKDKMVDVDEALALAYPLFVYSDSMRAFSHVRGARIIQRWFKAGVWPPYNREVVAEEEEVPVVALSSPRLKLSEAIAKDAEINAGSAGGETKEEWRKEKMTSPVTTTTELS